MIRAIGLLACCFVMSCALLTSAADELATCTTSADCGCEEHCGPTSAGSRACVQGCEADADCEWFGSAARCGGASNKVCDRSSGQCVAECLGDAIRCGVTCCSGINPSCIGEGEAATCCQSGFSCGTSCCSADSAFYECSGNTCVHK